MTIDAHVHVEQYGDIEDAIRRIEVHAIETFAVSMDPASYCEIQGLAGRCDLIIPSFGIHPWHAHRYRDRLDELDGYCRSAPMLGEVGLDYCWAEKEHFPAQKPVFAYFCREASRSGKLLNIHTKDAEEEVLGILQEHDVPRALIHWYAGPHSLVSAYLDIGAYFTLSVSILGDRYGSDLTNLIPPDRILLETDNPGGYDWLYGRQGRPEDIMAVYERAALLYNMPAGEFAAQVADNRDRLLTS